MSHKDITNATLSLVINGEPVLTLAAPSWWDGSPETARGLAFQLAEGYNYAIENHDWAAKKGN
jgi:hypothetical protein